MKYPAGAPPWVSGRRPERAADVYLDDTRLVLQLALLAAVAMAVFIIALALAMKPVLPSGTAQIVGATFRTADRADYSARSERSTAHQLPLATPAA
jgi:hypothetical protein